MLSATMEDHLKALYYLLEDSSGRVRTSDLAEHMDVEQSTVTSMVKKLFDRDLVHYEPYKGVEFTETGEPIALEIVRNHRLLERYLAEHLGYDWSKVHDEADRLEHHISDRFVDRIAEHLGNPAVDPHGDPIPTADLKLSLPTGTPLVDHRTGDRVRIERVPDQEAPVLEYLAKHGIKPGITAEITEVAPFGMVTLTPDDRDDSVSLPGEFAHAVVARSLTEQAE